MRTLFMSSLLLALVLSLCRVACAQQEFASETKSWSFTMPEGWEPMSQQQLDKIKQQYKLRNPDDTSRVIVGFIKTGGLFAYPQVLVQVLETDMSKVSWHSLDRMISKGYDDSLGAQSAANLAELVGGSGADDAKVDQNARTISGAGGIVMDDQSEVHTACRAFLYSSGAIQLTGLDYKNNQGGAQRALDAFAGSFHIASGREFVAAADTAPPPRSAPQRSSYSSSGYGYYGGGGGAVIVVIAVIARIWLRSWARGD